MKIFLKTCFLLLLLVTMLKAKGLELAKLPNFINSQFDEFPCFIEKGNLVFIRKEKNSFLPFVTQLSNYSLVVKFNVPKEYQIFEGSFISFFHKDGSNYFAFSGKTKSNPNSDIWFLKQKKGSKKASLIHFNHNTKLFESHPQFSPDGKVLFFTAENEEPNKGTEIFFTNFEDETFGELQLLKEISTDQNEITPFVDKNGDLYFARYDTTNYNIYKAKKIGENQWAKPRLLPYPINTEYNELSPVVYEGKIFFATDRDNAGFDIFSANLCFPIFLEVNFIESPGLFSSYDKVILFDDNENTIEERYLGNNTSILFNLQPNINYQAKIYNECTKETYLTRKFKTLCIDTSFVKYVINFEISNNLTKEKNIPFFLTGYYKPITNNNLNQLKKLFDYNLIGKDDTTIYIEYPGKIYFEVSEKVEEALQDIIDHISYFAKVSKDGCISKEKKLKVEIIGYADPRPLSPKARFFEETIQDPYFNFYLEKGTSLNNELLSKLRAYFTAKELFILLTKEFGQEFVKSHIKWEIKGGGIIEKEEDYLLLRKVNIKINFETKEI